MTRPQIMPCRACGSPDVQAFRSVQRPSRAFVMCNVCGYRGKEDDTGDAARAIRLWNRESTLGICPCCKGSAEIQDVGGGDVIAVCQFCGLRTGPGQLETVISTWNHREVD